MDILRYREQLLDWVNRINLHQRRHDGETIEGVCLGVREGHIIKKLRDRQGIWLCAAYPDFVHHSGEDAPYSQHGLLLYIVEKTPSGSHTDEQEILRYAVMQQLMQRLITEIEAGTEGCAPLEARGAFNVEWEYDVFGGWNGLSVSLKAEEDSL